MKKICMSDERQGGPGKHSRPNRGLRYCFTRAQGYGRGGSGGRLQGWKGESVKGLEDPSDVRGETV